MATETLGLLAKSGALVGAGQVNPWSDSLGNFTALTTGVMSIDIYWFLRVCWYLAMAASLAVLVTHLLYRSRRGKVLLDKLIETLTRKGLIFKIVRVESIKIPSDMTFLKRRFLNAVMSMACARHDREEGQKVFDSLISELSSAKEQFAALHENTDRAGLRKAA
jgi:hypothetical protein